MTIASKVLALIEDEKLPRPLKIRLDDPTSYRDHRVTLQLEPETVMVTIEADNGFELSLTEDALDDFIAGLAKIKLQMRRWKP